jgi:hypothetical protein
VRYVLELVQLGLVRLEQLVGRLEQLVGLVVIHRF